MELRDRQFPGQRTTEETAREQVNRKLARRAAREGYVLLKNEGKRLPLSVHTPIALYGRGASRTIKGGSGSGEVNDRGSVSIYEGVKRAGFVVANEKWIEAYEAYYTAYFEEWREQVSDVIHSCKKDGINDFFTTIAEHPFNPSAGQPLDEAEAAADQADFAIFVLSRTAGESVDRREEKGDYYLTDEEEALLAQVCRCYKDVMFVVNSGSIIDLSVLDQYSNITSVLYMGQGGQEGGTAFADILCGRRSPSGKLTDSWPFAYKDYPCADGFGFGLTYTDFKVACRDLSLRGDRIVVHADVRNVGETYSSKDVVQLYVSCPQGGMPKEFRRLCAFKKTARLAPGAEETLHLEFPLHQLASYDEAAAAYVLTAGTYGIWLGDSLESSQLEATLELDEDFVTRKCRNICPLQQELKEISSDRILADARERQWKMDAADRNLPSVKITASALQTEVIDYKEDLSAFSEEAGDIVKKLSDEQLVRLCIGDIAHGQGSELDDSGQSVPGAAAETVHDAEKLGVASIVLADGPAGLRLTRKYYIKDGKVVKQPLEDSFQGGVFATEKLPEGDFETRYQYCTAIPVGTVMAQTWNVPLITEVGAMIGEEMKLFEVSLWLAPGMNIHRNPLCGRNFEYYSEDPYVAGMTAAAMTKGVQSVDGCGTTIKHFCCNNSEDNRMGSDSVISERALREIYIKGFEIAVMESQPMAIMTSYNMVNGVHTANSYDLCMAAARKEWGFEGLIMTDWLTTVGSTAGECTAAGCMKASNDLVMPGMLPDPESLRKALADGSLSLDELRRNADHIIRVILHTNQYKKPQNYSTKFENLRY